jgi:tRNA-binding protein
MNAVDYSNFSNLDIRVGTINSAEWLDGARNPSFKLQINFGKEIGVLKSSAQITDQYSVQDLFGKQILAVVNFPKKQIGNFMSECLVLGVYGSAGVVLLQTDMQCENGQKVG